MSTFIADVMLCVIVSVVFSAFESSGITVVRKYNTVNWGWPISVAMRSKMEVCSRLLAGLWV